MSPQIKQNHEGLIAVYLNNRVKQYIRISSMPHSNCAKQNCQAWLILAVTTLIKLRHFVVTQFIFILASITHIRLPVTASSQRSSHEQFLSKTDELVIEMILSMDSFKI